MVEEKHLTDETALAKSSELVGTMVAPQSIDLLPKSLTRLELEILNLLLFWQIDLPQKYIENVIQTVYIFDRAIIIPALEQKGTRITPFLKRFIILFVNYKTEVRKTKTDDYETHIKQEYFTPDDKMPVEKKRLTLVTEINKIVPKPLAIPSHRAINNVLLNLEVQNFIRRKRVRTKTLWNVNLNFLQIRTERRKQIIDEFVKLKNESRENTKEERERDAMAILLDKYSPNLLELLGIEYWKYLTDKEPISLVLRYMNDVQQLTRY